MVGQCPPIKQLSPKGTLLHRHTQSEQKNLIHVKVKSFAPRQIQRRSFAALAITLSRKIF